MRNFKRTYKRPRTAWNSQQIADTHGLMQRYGLRRRRELLRAQAVVRDFRSRARQLIAQRDPAKEQILLAKLQKLGFLPSALAASAAGASRASAATLDDVLALTVNSILDRRLQTLVHKRGMATSPLHARQVIAHGHVAVAGRRTKFPSYLVAVGEEASIAWYGKELTITLAPAREGAVPADALEAAAEAAEVAEAKE